jgi:serine phosphatase RsbU (regulator of sigma subunit)
VAAPADRVRDLIRISDPALSELEFDALLDELLVRVRDLLKMDTAAILLLDSGRDQLVATAAKGIEEARLVGALEREHSNAVMLQRSLLPRQLDPVRRSSVAARYLPARDEVGGDWYDLIELPHGRVGAVIGDVVGHGLAAATLMGQLRTALHAYALEDHPPGKTRRHG